MKKAAKVTKARRPVKRSVVARTPKARPAVPAVASAVVPAPPRQVDSASVRTYLAQARAAHARYREHAGRINKQGNVSHVPDVFTTTAAITEALRARCLAEAEDPQATDPAWIEDAALMKATNADLISFYVKYLTPLEAYLQDGAA